MSARALHLPRPESTAPPPRRAWLLGGLAVAAFGVMTLIHAGDSRLWTAAENLAEALAAALAAIACLQRVKRERSARALDPASSSRTVLAWSLITLGVVAWATGQFGWTILESASGVSLPQVSALDLSLLLFPVLVTVGLLATVRTPAGSLTPLRAVLEGLFIASGFLLLSWSLVVSEAVGGLRLPPLDEAVNLAYPALDVVAISAALFVALRSRRDSPPGLGLVAVGIATIAFSDSIYWYLKATGHHVSGPSPLGTGWVAGFVLIAFGALWLRTPSRRARLTDRRWTPLLPAIPAAAGVIAMVARWGHFSAADQPTLCAIVASVLTLAIALGLVVAYENRALTRDLEHRVRRRTAELESAEGRFRALVEHSSDVILVLDAGLRIKYVSDSASEVFGFRASQLLGETTRVFGRAGEVALENALARAAVAPGACVSIAWELTDSVGRRRLAESMVSNLLHEPFVEGFVLNTRDRTEAVELEAQLREDSVRDSLCGVANRLLLEERVGEALQRGRRRGTGVALVALDLDRFTLVNDRHGHKVGDRLLREVAGRLSDSVRRGDTVARLGGDEFLVLLDEVSGPADALARAERLRAALSEPAYADGAPRAVALTASFGVAPASDGHATYTQLTNDADMAMRSVKAGGKDAVALFTPAMLRQARERAGLQAELAQALRREELWLLYEPRFDLADGRLHGFQVRARWNHPRRGLLHSSRFAAVLEQSGLGVQLGRWMLTRALREVVGCERVAGGSRLVAVEVALSSVHLEAPGLLAHVEDALTDSGAEPSQLTLGIPERAVLEGARRHVEVVDELRRLGVTIALDALGGGSAGAPAVSELPVDIIEVDPALVRAVGAGARGRQVLGAVIANAHAQSRAALADGVELLSQLLGVRDVGCDLAQGPLLGAPLSIEEARRLAAEDVALADLVGSRELLPRAARGSPTLRVVR